MENCKFLATDLTPVLGFSRGKYGVLKIVSTDFTDAILNFEALTIEDAFMVANCTFNQPFGAHSFNFPENNTQFQWSQVSDYGLGIYRRGPVYVAQTDSQLADVNKYNMLISAYNKFFHSFKTQGDRKSANSVYVSMKDIETRRLSYLYGQDRSLESWFDWRLNQFLKFFCTYGTSPVRSLIISMWIILGFATIYFFTYSDWDKINRTFLMRKYDQLLIYFQSEQKLEDFYAEEHREAFISYDKFRSNVEKSVSQIPLFIKLLGKPLYNLSMIHHKVMQWLYRRTEILSGRWIDLSSGRKTYVGILVSLAVTIYGLYLFSFRAFNSLFLSLNTFTTLGFGEIPVKGIGRYLAILEGFLGWFLLSIFSVSLISQILQN